MSDRVVSVHGLRIVDLTPENVDDSINLCIGRKPGYEQAREEKRRWLEERLPNGVGGKLAYQDGQLAGMLEFCPIEYVPFPISGSELLHINCVWVLPQFQRKGIGESLVKSCFAETRLRGKRGVSVIAYDGTFFMPSTFFLNQGFRTVSRRETLELMWSPLEPCKPPAFLIQEYSPEKIPGKLAVDVLCSAQCPWSVMTRERIKRVSREFGGTVKLRSININDRQAVEKFGDSKKVFVDGNESFLISPTEDDIRKVLKVNLESVARSRSEQRKP
jgi:ribosomal protein S18 acetylase RimI-like enzyme